MSTFLFVNRLQPKERGKLIELLREFSVSMHSGAGCVHCSIHLPGEGETTVTGAVVDRNQTGPTHRRRDIRPKCVLTLCGAGVALVLTRQVEAPVVEVAVAHDGAQGEDGSGAA